MPTSLARRAATEEKDPRSVQSVLSGAEEAKVRMKFRSFAGRRWDVVLVVALLVSCGHWPEVLKSSPYEYFAKPDSSDPWSYKITEWQQRAQRVDTPDVAASGSASDLRKRFHRFQNEQRRALAGQLMQWVQEESLHSYRPDGWEDRWATLKETLDHSGDDCDGLELLSFHLLREFGFDETEVFRGVVYRKTDNQHHMVTLWFEDRNDPWVLDPTGIMTTKLVRMSQLEQWVPLKVFSGEEEYSVERTR